MRRIESECVGCDLPCIDCGRKHVEVVRCDSCEANLSSYLDSLPGIAIDGQELCYECAKNHLIQKFYYSAKRKRDFYRYSNIDDKEFILELNDLNDEELYNQMMEEDFEVIADDCGAEWNELEDY